MNNTTFVEDWITRQRNLTVDLILRQGEWRANISTEGREYQSSFQNTIADALASTLSLMPEWWDFDRARQSDLEAKRNLLMGNQ